MSTEAGTRVTGGTRGRDADAHGIGEAACSSSSVSELDSRDGGRMRWTFLLASV